jgi:hypothetical protein
LRDRAIYAGDASSRVSWTVQAERLSGRPLGLPQATEGLGEREADTLQALLDLYVAVQFFGTYAYAYFRGRPLPRGFPRWLLVNFIDVHDVAASEEYVV